MVGTATGKGFSRLGHNVYFCDRSHSRLLDLQEQGYQVEEIIQDAILKTEISFICVGAPTQDNSGKQDLTELISILTNIASVINNTDDYHLLVFRTTLLPGTTRNIIVHYLEKNSSAKNGKNYGIIYNPEFLREGTALVDFLKSDRVIIGAENGGVNHYSILREIYEPITPNIITVSYEAAELIKYVSNCFLSLKISFFNEIGILCEKLGIDDKLVNFAVSLDKRIGSYGTESGRPFGGSCLPKDTEAFAAFIRNNNIQPDLVQTALKINQILSSESAKHQAYFRYRRNKIMQADL